MLKKVIVTKEYERKTYLKGTFLGKYRGKIATNQFFTEREKFYDLEIYWAQIQEVPFPITEEEYQSIKSKANLKVSFDNIEVIPADKLGDFDVYRLKIREPKVNEISISLVQKEDDGTYGTITGKLYGYILDIIQYEEEEWLEFPDPMVEFEGTSFNPPAKKTEDIPGPVKDRFNWAEAKSGCGDFFQIFSYLLLAVMVVFFLIIIGFAGRVFVGSILLIGVLFWLLPKFFRAISSLFSIVVFGIGRLLGLGLILVMLFSLASLFTGKFKSTSSRKPLVTEQELIPVEKDPFYKDSVIVHYRKWEDYDQNVYSGKVVVKQSEYLSSLNFRENLGVPTGYGINWNRVYSKIFNNTHLKIEGLVNMLDSIRRENDFTKKQFAEVVVSFIQDIPYAFVLPGSCAEGYRSNNEIREVIKNCEGICCKGNVAYGLQSPPEFLANLLGDCDTRTLLGFTILERFNYDVIILGSTYYKHSVLGVNLPYSGVYKILNGKRYYVWETTAFGIRPGIISPRQSRMAYWEPHLTTKYY